MAISKLTRALLPVLLCLLLAGFAAGEPESAPGAPADSPAAVEAPAPPADAPAPEEPAATAEEPAAAEEQPAPAEEPAAVEEEPAPAETPAEEPAAVEEEPAPTETPPEEPAEPTGPVIVAVEVKGNERIATDTILEGSPLKVGDVYTPERGSEAAKKIQDDLGWFFSVTASARPEQDGVRLTIEVVENAVILGIAFEGNTLYSDEKLRGLMETQPDTVWNGNTLRRDIAAIQDAYHKAGYIFARVLPPEIDERTMTLVIPIVEGIVEAIRIEGRTKTRAYVITRELRTRVGQVYNQQVMNRDLQRLLNLDLFETISVDWQAGTKVGEIIVIVRVKERKTGLASIGVGYSSVQNLVGFVDATETNLKGTAQLVNVRAEFGGRSSYEVGYYNPWITSKHTSLRVGLYNKMILREAYTEEESFVYDEKRSGGNVTVSRPLSDATRIYTTLRADDVSARAEDDETLPDDVALLQESQVRSVGLAVVNDTRDLIANPSRGGMNSLSAEQAGIGGGARFGKFGADVRRYLRAGSPDRIIAIRLLAGVTTGDPPYLEQFLVGGAETLRGYANDRYPGRRMAIVNVEYRFPISKKSKLIGVVFGDAGDAWSGSFAEQYGDKEFTVHVGYGVGIRVVTPIGPLRLDYGIGSDGAETHFSVGHVF